MPHEMVVAKVLEVFRISSQAYNILGFLKLCQILEIVLEGVADLSLGSFQTIREQEHVQT